MAPEPCLAEPQASPVPIRGRPLGPLLSPSQSRGGSTRVLGELAALPSPHAPCPGCSLPAPFAECDGEHPSPYRPLGPKAGLAWASEVEAGAGFGVGGRCPASTEESAQPHCASGWLGVGKACGRHACPRVPRPTGTPVFLFSSQPPRILPHLAPCTACMAP